MDFQVVSFDGHTDINDGSHANTYFPDDQGIKQSPVRITYVPRQRAAPVYGSKVRQERTLQIVIEMLGTIPVRTVYAETLKGYFPVEADDDDGKVLLVKDADDSNRQWYLNTTVANQDQIDDRQFIITLMAGDGIWRSALTHTDSTWSVTASGQTHNVTPNPVGNADAFPIFTITPSTAKGGGAAFKIFSLIRNQMAKGLTTYPFDVTHGGWNTSILVSDTSRSNQINVGGGINASVTTIPIDTAVGGGLPATGLCYCGTEQIQYTGNSGTNLTGCTRGVGGTVAASHADNAVITMSNVFADGRDVRVLFAGVEKDFWIGTGANAFNTTVTKLFVNLDLAAKVELTLKTALSGVGTPASIVFTKGSVKDFNNLPAQGRIHIDSETFTYTTKVPNRNTPSVTGILRALDGTSAGAHSTNATCYWIQYSVLVTYGDVTETAMVTNDAKKPIIDLTSSNTSWVYTSFMDTARQRSGVFSPVIAQLDSRDNQSTSYTATQFDFADPATSMGSRIASYLYGNTYQQPTADLSWFMNHPAGVTTITSTGKKYRVGTKFPAVASLERSANGLKWVAVWTDATPGTPSNWTAWTHNAQSLSGTYNYFRFRFAGAASQGSTFEADFEVDTVTLTLDSGNVPTGSFGTANGAYVISAIITLVNTGESFNLTRVIDTNQSEQVDCFNAQTLYLFNNTPGPLIEPDTDREYWLRLLPGVVNQLKYEDTSGVTGTVAVGISFQDRMR